LDTEGSNSLIQTKQKEKRGMKNSREFFTTKGLKKVLKKKGKAKRGRSKKHKPF